jgi:hypothetical protein
LKNPPHYVCIPLFQITNINFIALLCHKMLTPFHIYTPNGCVCKMKLTGSLIISPLYQKPYDPSYRKIQ